MAVCNYCGSKFSTNGNLYRHVRKVHKLKCSFKKDTPLVATVAKQKKVACKQCDEMFNNRSALLRHRKKIHIQDEDPRNQRKLISETTKRGNENVKLLPEYDLQTLLSHVDGVKLPEGYNYQEIKRSTAQSTIFFVEFKFALANSEETFNQWMTELKEVNKMLFRKETMHHAKKQTVVYKKRFRCRHNVRSSSSRNTPDPKRTKCPFYLCVIVFKSESRCAAKVRITGKHNHEIDCASYLRFRDVSKDVEEKMLNLFSNGFGPAKAYQEHLKDLKDDYGEDFHKIQGDRHLCPEIQWIYRLRDKVFKQQYGPQFGIKMLNVLQEKVDEFNDRVCVGGARLKVIDENNNYVLSLMTPFMLRVHEHFLQSCEIAFIDGTASVDSSSCKVLLILTNSCVGALPLGVIITTSESTNAISQGFTMFKSLLSEKSFGGRGNRGPQIFMTDDSSAIRAALEQNFPEATLLICEFHILLDFWRYINDDKSEIEYWHRTDLFNQLKNLLNAPDSAELQKKFDKMLANDVTKKNSTLVSYISELYKRKKEWAKFFYSNIIPRWQYTNDASETSMRVLKDSVMRRFKAYSPVHLFKILTTDFESHFIDKLVDISNDRIPSCYKIREMKLMRKCTGMQHNGNGKVTDTKKNNHTYAVNTHDGICACPDGVSGHPCKHVYYLLRRSPHDPDILIFENQNEKNLVYYIATGNQFPNNNEEFCKLPPSPLKCDRKHRHINIGVQDDQSSFENFELNYPENDSSDLIVYEEVQCDELPLENFNSHHLGNYSHSLQTNKETQAGESSLDNDLNNALVRFQFMYESIVEKIKENSSLSPYVLEMTRNYSKIRTIPALKTALATFGTCDDNADKTPRKCKT